MKIIPKRHPIFINYPYYDGELLRDSLLGEASQRKITPTLSYLHYFYNNFGNYCVILRWGKLL